MESRLCDRPSFTYDELSFTPFRNSGQVEAFHCGDPDLDEFLNTQEVAEYQRLRLGRTWLVHVEGELVAYYTIAPGSLHVAWIKKGKKSFSKSRKLVVEEIPALKLGRFAIRQDLHRKGLGTLLMDHIKGLALTWEYPCSIIVLNAASEEAVRFYESCEFVVSEHHRNKNRDQKVMFYVLDAISDLA